MVAVISNGTAVLGLGDIGALASKPVMEGKAVLFKKFADIDGVDLCLDTGDVDAFVNCARYLGPSFGGVNLEDIKAPECFIIEQRLKELLDIPVFHDDQHGTAIIATAGLINALHLTGRDIATTRMVVNGAAPRPSPAWNWLRRWACRRKRDHLRHSRGDLPRPRNRHESMEIGACGAHPSPQPGRGHGRR